ncbi:MAG: HEPN domain-containing protein [Phycisphaerae bacterium]|nr:HEPN domain-containing protein [Phycisphaerae bacterium]
MGRELRAQRCPSYNGGCFHAQQCAEKYLKGRLAEAGQPIPKIHALVVLLDLVTPLEPTWDVFRADLGYLANFAVLPRYPGPSANKQILKDAVRRCRAFRVAARASLGLK